MLVFNWAHLNNKKKKKKAQTIIKLGQKKKKWIKYSTKNPLKKLPVEIFLPWVHLNAIDSFALLGFAVVAVMLA